MKSAIVASKEKRVIGLCLQKKLISNWYTSQEALVYRRTVEEINLAAQSDGFFFF